MSPDAVDLKDVSSLAFKKGMMTSARRVSAVPQLSCVSGDACRTHAGLIDSITCQNKGADRSGAVQWACSAMLDSGVRLGETSVTCEGYESSSDPLKLRGTEMGNGATRSCGLEYSLLRYDGGASSSTAQYKKGDRALYYDKRSGTTKEVEIVYVGSSMRPPSYTIRVDGRERETEAAEELEVQPPVFDMPHRFQQLDGVGDLACDKRCAPPLVRAEWQAPHLDSRLLEREVTEVVQGLEREAKGVGCSSQASPGRGVDPALRCVDLQVEVLPHAVGKIAGGSQHGLELADQEDVVHVDHGENPWVAVQDPHHHLVEGHGEEGARRNGYGREGGGNTGGRCMHACMDAYAASLFPPPMHRTLTAHLEAVVHWPAYLLECYALPQHRTAHSKRARRQN